MFPLSCYAGPFMLFLANRLHAVSCVVVEISLCAVLAELGLQAVRYGLLNA
jgi:hypothetical protein